MEEPASGVPAGGPRGISEDLIDPANWASNIVEKYNATARKLFDAQGRIQQVQEQQGKSVQELQKLATQNEELDVKQQKMIEELQQADKTMQESIRSLLEDRVGAAKTEAQQALRSLDETLSPKFVGLENAIEDLVGQQKEMQSKTLPRWRADVGTEIQSLRTDFTQHREQTARSHEAQQDVNLKAEAAAREATAGLESKLVAEIAELKAHLGKADSAIAALSSELAGLKKGLGDVGTQRVEDLAGLNKRLDGVESAQGSHTSDGGKMRERVDKFETVVHHVLYEFEDFKSKTGTELASAKAGLEERAKDLDGRRDEAEKRLLESLEEAKRAADQALAGRVAEVLRKMAATEESCMSSVDAVKEKSSEDASRVTQLLEQKCLLLEQQSKANAEEVLRAIRSDETPRLDALECSLKTLQGSQTELAQKQKKDLGILKEDVLSVQNSSDLKMKDLEGASQARLQCLQQAVNDLAQMFQEFGMLQQNQEGYLKQLDQVVKAMEIKLWPWKTRNRSNSPGASRPSYVRPDSATRRAPAAEEQHKRLSMTLSTDAPEDTFGEKVSDGFVSTRDGAGTPFRSGRPGSAAHHARGLATSANPEPFTVQTGRGAAFAGTFPAGAARNPVIAKARARTSR